MPTCPGCHTDHGRTLAPAGHPGQPYWLCRGCGLGHLAEPPRHPEDLYTRDYFVDGGALAGYTDYEADERWHRKTARSRLRRVRTALEGRTGAQRLVDVGAATGFFLDVAHEEGWQVQGVEASQWAAGRARGKGHAVVTSLDELPGEPQLDAVTFFQVLEHLPDPQRAVAQAATMLRPGGVLVCETWDAASRTARWSGSHWQQLSPPSVLWLFTRGSLETIARQAGLELVSFHPTPKLVSLATVLGQSGLGQSGLGQSGLGQSAPRTDGGRGARLVRELGRAVPLPYPLDDLVTAVFRKPCPPARAAQPAAAA